MEYRAPGVYVGEVSEFNPSVNEVKTAVPAFIGYTEKAGRNGAELRDIPTRISSMVEYEELFGGSFQASNINVWLDENRGYDVTEVEVGEKFFLYQSLSLFFLNGGSECYIVSIGDYSQDPAFGYSPLEKGLLALAECDEPTIIVMVDAVCLSSENEFYSLQKKALAQCADLRDRICLLDVYEGPLESWQESIDNFRANIGTSNLKYGAAYTPWLKMSNASPPQLGSFISSVRNLAGQRIDLAKLTRNIYLNGLVTSTVDCMKDAQYARQALYSLEGTFSSLEEKYQYLRKGSVSAAGSQRYVIFVKKMVDLAVKWMNEREFFSSFNPAGELDSSDTQKMKVAIKSFNRMMLSQTRSKPFVTWRIRPVTVYRSGADRRQNLLRSRPVRYPTQSLPFNDRGARLKKIHEIDQIFAGGQVIFQFFSGVENYIQSLFMKHQSELFSEHPIIKKIHFRIDQEFTTLPPSGVIAGVCAQVDSHRGVWKAPANINLIGVHQPQYHITDIEQDGLNVSPDGKSINAIREFLGRGVVVWGARTLAGNDNEWRYVPVRRFFIMVEESIKKSTEWAVFEPNDAVLWQKIRGMIENYLLTKWRDGALAGAKPEEAFFVNVGLGTTMTSVDILEGRLIIEFGLAVLRPAEFIVSRIVKQLQQP